MKRIGLYLNNLDEEYQISIYKMVKKETKLLGYDLICIQGFPSSMITHLKLNGVMLLTSVLIDSSILNRTSELESYLKNIPSISMGCRIDKMPSVTINSKKSMCELMDHLILFHKYKKLLFLGGPRFHQDNISRESIFRQKINSFKEQFPDITGTILNGEFHESSAIILISNYIKKHKNSYPDGIVCANDQMASGVKKALYLEKDKNWRRCAVTGYDDIQQSENNISDLTTIHQPLEKLCRDSANVLHCLINNIKTEKHIVINSELFIRSSCGCTKMDKNCIPRKIESSHLKNQLNNNRQVTIKMDQYLRTVSFFGQRLTSIESLKELITHLKGLLQVFNIKIYYLLTYPDNNNGNSEQMQLIYKKENEKEFSYTDNVKLVSISSIFGNDVISVDNTPSSYILYHLVSGNEQLGMVIYESDTYSNAHLCTSSVFITNAIKQLKNLEMEKKRSSQLEELVALRTMDLVKTNKKLKLEAQKRLEVEAEVLKISEMERMRFSMDLHDDICQRLGGIAMYSKSLTDTSKLKELSSLIDETLQRTRQYAHKSFPMDLGNLGLEAALSGLCFNIEKQTELTIFFSWNIMDLFTNEEEMNIFRIVQEALNNIVKHSKATKAELKGSIKNKEIIISIADNGIGTQNTKPLSLTNPLEGKRPQGLGLRSMEYRAHQIQAIYSISSIPTLGTTIKINIPRKE